LRGLKGYKGEAGVQGEVGTQGDQVLYCHTLKVDIQIILEMQ